jgi:LAGLIDADG endonuclease
MEHFISSDNQLRADNQQGRLDPWWITGFVDGEGCFSISIFRNNTTKSGVQIFPEFVVTQGAKSLSVLEDLQRFFQCGNIYENRRTDNHRESLYRYCVRSFNDLEDKIIPFFEKYPLRTAKRHDLVIFRQVIRLIKSRIHLTPEGIEKIRTLAATMNRRKVRI